MGGEPQQPDNAYTHYKENCFPIIIQMRGGEERLYVRMRGVGKAKIYYARQEGLKPEDLRELTITKYWNSAGASTGSCLED